MNFSELDNYERNDINLLSLYNYDFIDEKSDNYLDGNLILTTYKKLMKSLEDYKNDIITLNKNKDDFFNYQSNLFNNHLNIINLCDYDNNTTEIFINYNNIIKEKFDKWLNDNYKPQLAKLEEEIQSIELKLANFRKLFIFIINNFINKEELETKKICSICFENEVDMCSIPCGHTCCSKCVISNRSIRSSSLNNYDYNNNCLNCRNKIDNYIKIYFLI